MIDDNDRITRKGLQAFADKCKETFLLPSTANTIPSVHKVVEYKGTLPKTTGLFIFNINMIGLVADDSNIYSQSSADIQINLDKTDLSVYYDSGVTRLDKIYYKLPNEGSNDIYIYIITNLYGSTILQSASLYNNGVGSKIQMAQNYSGVDDSLINGSYHEVEQKIVSQSSGNSTQFSLLTGPKDGDKKDYSSGTDFDTIRYARQLNHTLQFEVSNEQSDYKTDLSPTSENVTTIYVKGISQDTGNFSGVYDSVTVANGIVVNGTKKVNLYATDSSLGYVQLGHTGSTKELPLKLDTNHRAYVELPTGLLTYKGSVNTYDELPAENNTNGDVYSVADNFGAEYVWIVKDDEKGNWEYLGEKFKQVQADLNETNAESASYVKGKETLFDGKYTSLTLTPTITKPTISANGKITLDTSNIIDIKNASAIAKGTDILASQAYVDERTPTIQLNNTDVTKTEDGKLNIQAITSVEIGESDEISTEGGKVTLPKYPTVPITQINVDNTQANPDNGVVSISLPEVPIKSISLGDTALTPNDDGNVNIPPSQYFANLEYENSPNLDISNFITETPFPTHHYEKTILIYNKSANDITVTLPSDNDSVDIIRMTEALAVPPGKYCEVVGTYWPSNQDGDKPKLTINGGVQV